MRISDWSSDVCSSDLRLDTLVERHERAVGGAHRDDQILLVEHLVVLEVVEQRAGRALGVGGEEHRGALDAFGRAARKRGGKLRHRDRRSEEHTSELQSLMRISYAVFCLKKKKLQKTTT